MSYDCNGNLKFDGNLSYTYDAENRLMTASKTGLAAAYQYDPLGRRTRKSGTGVTGTFYLSDGSDEIVEYDGTSGTLTTRYIPGPAIDEPIAMVDGATGTKTYFHTNHQGSVIAMSGSGGALIEGPYTYDPYGNCFLGATQTPCSSSGEPYRFTGRRLDPETGCYYYRAREYCPAIGRFLQTDPVGYTADLNLYTYVGNDPMDFTDPSGESLVGDMLKWAIKQELKQALKQALKAAKEAAKRQAWAQEKRLVEKTGRGTREWTEKEEKQLLKEGKVDGYQAHHINNAADHPELAGDPDNIKFVGDRDEHLAEHGGNFANKSTGSLVDRTAGGTLPKPPLAPSVTRLNSVLKQIDHAMNVVDEATNAVSLNPLDAGGAQ